jgi:hypothetical protein
MRSAEKTRLLLLAMRELAGEALISFEGNLNGLRLLSLPGASSSETAALKRATTWPKQDFIVVPLEPALIAVIVGARGGSVSRRILHVQIEKRRVREFAAYDNFDRSCIVLGPAMNSSETSAICFKSGNCRLVTGTVATKGDVCHGYGSKQGQNKTLPNCLQGARGIGRCDSDSRPILPSPP